MVDIRKYIEQNRRAWNEIAEIRAKRWAEKRFWRRDRNRFPVWVDAGLGLLAELSEYSYDA